MRKKVRPWIMVAFAAVLGLVTLNRYSDRIPGATDLLLRLKGKATVADRLREYGPSARSRLRPYFEKAGVRYPPTEFVMVGLKRENRLEVYAGEGGQPLRYVRSYPIMAASGALGPKREYGDAQVPEGIHSEDYLHAFVDHTVEYTISLIHTNGLENFWSLMKHFIRGTYVSIEPEHLSAYIDEQAFQFNERKVKYPVRFVKVVCEIVGKHLAYQELIGNQQGVDSPDTL